jgi:hypothetical protein
MAGVGRMAMSAMKWFFFQSLQGLYKLRGLHCGTADHDPESKVDLQRDHHRVSPLVAQADPLQPGVIRKNLLA